MEMEFPLTIHGAETAMLAVQEQEEHRLEMRRLLD